jgi:hypothetical protein
MPGIRRAMDHVRQIPESDLWLLDLQAVLAKLEVAVHALVGPDKKLQSLMRADRSIAKLAAKRGKGVAS